MTTQPVEQERTATHPTTAKNEPTDTVMMTSGAFIGLNEAKRRTGKSKDTILRHAEKGTISTTLNGQGRKVYQVVDLERVFGFATSATSLDEGAHDQDDHDTQSEATSLENAILREKLRHSEELNRVFQEQAQRAEREAEDWKKQAAQAMRMLTYQPQPVAQDPINQPEPKPQSQPAAKKGFLGVIFGGRSR